MRRQGGLGRGLAELLPDAPRPGAASGRAPLPPSRGTVRERSAGVPGDGARSDVDRRTRSVGTTRRPTWRTWGLSSSPSWRPTSPASGSSTGRSTGSSSSYALHDAAVVIDEPGLGRQVFRAGRKPLDDPGGEALLDAEPGPLHRPAARSRGGRRVAAHQPVRRRAAHGGAALRLVARPAHRPLRPAQLRPAARDVGRPQPPVPLAVHASSSSTSTASRRSTTSRATRPATPRSQALGERFRRVLRFGDNAARIGGDEFAIILPNTDPDDVPTLLERIGSSQLGDRPCPAFSYGVAQCPAEADDMESLFKLAGLPPLRGQERR